MKVIVIIVTITIMSTRMVLIIRAKAIMKTINDIDNFNDLSKNNEL